MELSWSPVMQHKRNKKPPSIIVCNVASNGGVVYILFNRLLLMSGNAVMGVQCEPEGAEHKAMGGSSAEHKTVG